MKMMSLVVFKNASHERELTLCRRGLHTAHCFSRLIRTEDDREGEGREKRMTDDGKDGEIDFLAED